MPHFNFPIGSAGKPAQKPAPKASIAEHEPMEHEEGHSRPVMTHHHEDGRHTTIHEDGSEHDHENLEALKQHLDQFFTEEGHEGGEEEDGV